MNEKFFYRENPVNGTRVNLQEASLKALPIDGTFSTLPQLRNNKI